jgi:hypothetical protein
LNLETLLKKSPTGAYGLLVLGRDAWLVWNALRDTVSLLRLPSNFLPEVAVSHA